MALTISVYGGVENRVPRFVGQPMPQNLACQVFREP